VPAIVGFGMVQIWLAGRRMAAAHNA